MNDPKLSKVMGAALVTFGQQQLFSNSIENFISQIKELLFTAEIYKI